MCRVFDWIASIAIGNEANQVDSALPRIYGFLLLGKGKVFGGVGNR